MSGEIEYRLIVGTEAYRVGSDGSVWSRFQHTNPNENGRTVGAKYVLGEWRRLRLSRNRTGYVRVAIYRDGVQRKEAVHRLMLAAFVGPCPTGMVGCHTDDDRDNNALVNLRWDYPQANWVDRKRNGRNNPAQGESHGMVKLTALDVTAIWKAVTDGQSSSIVAQKYSVSYGYVRSIMSGKAWKHLRLAASDG